GMPDRRMVAGYIGALKDPEKEVRLAAVQALSTARFQAAAVVPALTKCLGDDSPVVREWAARILGLFGAAAEPALSELARLADDKVEAVRSTAKQAVARIEAGRVLKAEQTKTNPAA